MNVTQNVIDDLVPVYLAGEASADTVALVEEFLQQNPDFARTVDALRANPLPELANAFEPTQEKETLNMTKRLLRRRGILLGLALFLTLSPFTFEFNGGGMTWRYLRETPPVAAAAMFVAALGCWAGFLSVRRKLRVTGL